MVTFRAILRWLPALALAAGPAAAQQNMMLYPLADLPQRNQLNPALPYFGQGAVSIPLVSSPYVSFSNAFRYSDLIRRDADDVWPGGREHLRGWACAARPFAPEQPLRRRRTRRRRRAPARARPAAAPANNNN